MDVEGNRVVIVPQTKSATGGSNKPLGSATRFDWTNKPQSQPQPVHESESRSSQIRRSSLSQRHLSKQTKLCYRLADLVMVMCLIFPLAIAFWRGVWELMDQYSKQWGIDPWLSMGVGYSIPLIFHLTQEPLKRVVSIEKLGFPLFYTLSRSILLLHSFGSVNQWRGPWAWMDEQLGMEWKSAVIMMSAGIFLSILCKTLNNILAPPLFCIVDDSRSIHDCPLRFKTSPKKPFQYVLDCMFSVIVIPLLVVFCWRGMWTLADIFLFPEDEISSAMASICLGYSICITLCLAQPSVCQQLRNLKGFIRLAYTDCICVAGFVGCVLAWRGVWNSYNIFFVLDIPKLSEWITVIIGAFGTMILGCISVVVVKGIAIDGDLVEDGSAEWLIPYVSVISTPVYDVPYPEPWVCRYFCTSQKIGSKNLGKRDPKLDVVTSDSSKPLTGSKKLANSLSNSVHPTIPSEDYSKRKGNAAKNNRFRLSDLPNIDSSSEEELGMRTKMIPPSEETNDDDINSNINRNNETEGQ